MASPEAISQMFVLFKTVWPTRVLDEDMVKVYHLFFQDIEDDDLIIAASNCVDTCQFWPVPAEVRKRLKTGSIPSAEAALSMALTADNVNELLPVVKAVLRNIGGLGALQERDFVMMRRHFLDAYAEISQAFLQKEGLNRYKALLPQIKDTIKLLEAPK